MTTPRSFSFTEREPVLVAGLVTWLLSLVGEFAVGHAHLFNDTTWSGLATTIAPIATAPIIGGISWFTRSVVRPVAKDLEPALQSVEKFAGLSPEQVDHVAAQLSKQLYTTLEQHFPADVRAGLENETPEPATPAVQ